MKTRIPRIFLSKKIIINQILCLSEENTHYVKNVLRMKIQNILEIFNNTDYIFFAYIVNIEKKNVIVKIFKSKFRNVESSLHIHLGQVISKSKKMDFTIQKSVEMGVNTITPLFSEYCNFRNNQSNILKKIQHWNKIAISACQQCNRNIIPDIKKPKNIFLWCKNNNKNDIKIIFDQNSYKKIHELPKPIKYIQLIIGSEGGFSEIELKQIIKYGFVSIGLGPRILRTETAAIAAITALQITFGDLS